MATKRKKPLHASVRKPLAPGKRVMRSKKAYDRKNPLPEPLADWQMRYRIKDY